MTSSNTKDMTSEINVTPMIDVLLVLLIIFMVIVPAIPKGETVRAPQPQSRPMNDNPETVVLEMLKGSGGDLAFTINQQSVARKDLPTRLASVYANRAQRVLFLKGDDRLSFNEVADVIDISHAAGIDRVGLMTPRVLAGQ
ncbi:MAG: biopolymer transporter ExbD [Terracidiphilus sp.]|jgi:biopolymer transport protein ExbD